MHLFQNSAFKLLPFVALSTMPTDYVSAYSSPLYISAEDKITRYESFLPDRYDWREIASKYSSNSNAEFNLELKVLFSTITQSLGINVEDYWIPNKSSNEKKCIFVKCNTDRFNDDVNAIAAFELSLYEVTKDILAKSNNFEMVALL